MLEVYRPKIELKTSNLPATEADPREDDPYLVPADSNQAEGQQAHPGA